MKTIRPFVILMLLFLLAWNVFGHSSNLTFDFDGEQFDGPLGAMAGFLFAGGGMIIAALVVVAAVSPLLLPFLIPVAIAWFFVSRARRNRIRPNII